MYAATEGGVIKLGRTGDCAGGARPRGAYFTF